MNLRGKFTTNEQSRFWFRSVRPAGYPVPTDGPTGDLLRAQKRYPFRPAHLYFLAFKPGYKTLITQAFVDDDDHLETDVVFGVTRHPARTRHYRAMVHARLHLRHGTGRSQASQASYQVKAHKFRPVTSLSAGSMPARRASRR
jgi:protocatechuate 3,4-dioxygenase beta subunit